jgi:hypothetical protein
LIDAARTNLRSPNYDLREREGVAVFMSHRLYSLTT